MGTIIDGKYKILTGEDEYTEEEYAKLKKEHPEIEYAFKTDKESQDALREIAQLKRMKAEITSRLSYLEVILVESSIGITEIERKLALQAEDTNLRAELAYVNTKLEG